MKMMKKLAIMLVMGVNGSAQCMEYKPKNRVKSLNNIAGEVVCKKGLFHKIEVPELKYQTQLMHELGELGKLFSYDADYEKVLSLITNYSDPEKLNYFYLVELFGDSHKRIVKACADCYHELLAIHLLNGHLLVESTKNEQDLLIKAALLSDESALSNAIAFIETDKLKKIINKPYEAFGALPLVEASRRGLLSNVAQLLELGADINGHDAYGKTALIVAALNGHLELVEMLLAHGADLNARDNQKLTALCGAILKGHIKIVEYLLGFVCLHESTGLLANSFSNPTVLAIRSMYPELLELVLNKTELSQCSINELVVIAAEVGNMQAAKWLLSKEAVVNNLCAGQRLPLVVACRHGSSEMVKLLLDHGAEVNKGDLQGNTALMAAARWGHTTIVQLLIERGARIDLANGVGTTAVMHAAIGGHLKTIKLLVNVGASLNLRGINENSALTLASFFGHKSAVQFLLIAGSGIDCVNNEGLTALMIAATAGHKETVELLLSHNAAVNMISNSGMTALLYAVENYHDDCVEPLLKAGAEINAADNAGNTPLILYSRRGSEEMVKLLLAYGADVSCTNKRGETAAMQNGSREILELLNAQKNS